MFWPTVIVIGRILAEIGSPPPDVVDEAVLLIKRQNVVIGCTPGDAGGVGDAALDAPSDAIADSGVGDAGVGDAGVGDAGVGDAGVPDAGTCTVIPGDAITMIVQPNVSTAADGTRFAVLLVTPERPIVELKSNVFEPLASITAPLVETRVVEVPDPALGTRCAQSAGCGGGGGEAGGGCGGGFNGSTWDPPSIGDAGLGDGGLVEETIGPYQFVRAKPSDSAQLAQWLDQLGYAYMQQDLDAVAPYIALGFHVIAIRVALDRPMTTSLTPLALTWPGSELRVPAALGRATGVGPGKLTVYIAGEWKYVLPGATVPFAKRINNSDMEYLTRNEIMLDQNLPPAQDPIAYHPDNLEYHEVKVITEEVYVPVEVVCGDEREETGCCSDCNAKPRTRIDLGLIVVALAFVLRRRRR